MASHTLRILKMQSRDLNFFEKEYYILYRQVTVPIQYGKLQKYTFPDKVKVKLILRAQKRDTRQIKVTKLRSDNGTP